MLVSCSILVRSCVEVVVEGLEAERPLNDADFVGGRGIIATEREDDDEEDKGWLEFRQA